MPGPIFNRKGKESREEAVYEHPLRENRRPGDEAPRYDDALQMLGAKQRARLAALRTMLVGMLREDGESFSPRRPPLRSSADFLRGWQSVAGAALTRCCLVQGELQVGGERVESHAMPCHGSG